ncbi:unnamed protein product [Cuscuta epithymum]|uniref:F-box domain-containing protein n=1 Tax=Cuscuta epithymum TaxID=186058 RepID=A0AAV0F7S4_9ASTE|nr:unnamed protein product [Cuscuta epithymum]
MVLECIEWIFHTWNDYIQRRKVGYIPKEIVFEILSRLPADEVLKCQRVSKEWKEIIIHSPLFSQTQLSRASPIILVQYVCPFLGAGKMQLYFLDEGAKKKDKMMENVYTKPTLSVLKVLCILIFSYNGFLIFDEHIAWNHTSEFFIYNPITREEVAIRKPVKRGGRVCGMYLHPSTGEYRFIYCIFGENGVGRHKYVIGCRGGGNVKWREVCSLRYTPSFPAAPVILNDIIYWVVNKTKAIKTQSYPSVCAASVLTFDTETEELRVMPHPGRTCTNSNSCQLYDTENIQLLEMENKLVFCHQSWKCIRIWMLEDPIEWHWVMRYSVSFHWVSPYFKGISARREIKLLRIRDGELLLCWYTTGLFLYHLELHTVRKLDLGIKKTGPYGTYTCDSFAYCNFASYTKSLESWTKDA